MVSTGDADPIGFRARRGAWILRNRRDQGGPRERRRKRSNSHPLYVLVRRRTIIRGTLRPRPTRFI